MSTHSSADLVVGLNAVIVAVTTEVPRVLTVRGAELPAPGVLSAVPQLALPFGPLDPLRDHTLELGLRRWVREQAGLSLGYVEQLYTFGDRNREKEGGGGEARVLSVAYLALVREEETETVSGTQWLDIYRFLPWEDWRRGRPKILDQVVVPALRGWRDSAAAPSLRRARSERIDIAFGLHGSPHDGYRVLDRYELLYEAGLVAEAMRDHQRSGSRRCGNTLRQAIAASALPGMPMAFDHRRILATALERLRGKIHYRPVVFELLPPTFTLLQLQRVVEALAGVRLHKQNFRRLVERGGLVEGSGRFDSQTGGRPAELFRFRREVLRERPTPGVGLPVHTAG